jgi:transcriptional regulator with GAF, ATPase, and Fis domain
VAASAEMRQVLELARRVARADASVLVTGESGVGKERVARLIHDESQRSAGPFVALNCGAVPEALIESELFGHARGEFTGAMRDRAGLFEEANKGSLLLDEVGELTPAMQVKLLRTLQTQEVRRVGENRPRKVDVRLIAATHRDLTEEVQKGRFRQDLYYRLKVIEIHEPPLRERKDDLLPLARVLLRDAAARAGSRVGGLTPAAADQLLRHDWPGNVRELDNAMQRAVVLASGRACASKTYRKKCGAPCRCRERAAGCARWRTWSGTTCSPCSKRIRDIELAPPPELGIGTATCSEAQAVRRELNFSQRATIANVPLPAEAGGAAPFQPSGQLRVVQSNSHFPSRGEGSRSLRSSALEALVPIGRVQSKRRVEVLRVRHIRDPEARFSPISGLIVAARCLNVMRYTPIRCVLALTGSRPGPAPPAPGEASVA